MIIFYSRVSGACPVTTDLAFLAKGLHHKNRSFLVICCSVLVTGIGDSLHNSFFAFLVRALN